MSNEPIRTITVPRGCPRPRTNIGKQPVTLKFMYTPRNRGEIREIIGLDEPPFSNKRFVDPDFLVDYAGSGSEFRSWRYQVVSDPACPTDDAMGDADGAMGDEDPELTNEPEG